MNDTRIIRVQHAWERFGEIQNLYFSVLYADFGVPRGADWYHDANGSVFAVVLDDSEAILGAARLLPAAGCASRQVRQVAVAPHAHGRGLGRLLIFDLEALAAEEGAHELWLKSRSSAYGFYERLGFVREGVEFESELTGIMHTTMRKRILGA